MKIASKALSRYFGTLTAIPEINVFKIDIQVVDAEHRTYQPILNLNLAPCAFSKFMTILEHVIKGDDHKEEHEAGFISCQQIVGHSVAVVNFARLTESSVDVNYSIVNSEIANLVIQLAQRILSEDESSLDFNSDCTS